MTDTALKLGRTWRHNRRLGQSAKSLSIRWSSNLPLLPNEPEDITGLSNVGEGEKVYVAMSGGVDSSTVAAILTERFGANKVEGVFMNNWNSLAKCQEASWRDVQDIAQHLHIPVRRVDLERDYWTDVFYPMLEAYQQGYTPNPDVSCNQYIKFGNLVKNLQSYDPQMKWIATGHYCGRSLHANLISNSELNMDPLVCRPCYLPKDQSYYLATVPPTVLRHALFPLAKIAKPDVRKLAEKYGLSKVAKKPDSQGLCFVEQQSEFGARGFRKFLSEYLTESPGPFVLAKNPDTVVGEHRGLWTHTIGQRASVTMPQGDPTMRGKWFVVGKDTLRNALLIDRGANSPYLYSQTIFSHDFQWHRPPRSNSLMAQYRSLQTPWAIKSWKFTGTELALTFFEPRRAVAAGQYLVIYENNAIIGAGTIV